ncbi:MAG: hypothetical protein ABI887_03595 [Burkholderiales bacterium]
MNAATDPRACAGTTVVALLAVVACCCLVASPLADDAVGWNTPVALHSGEQK